MQHSCSICHHSRCLKLEKLMDVSHVCRAATVAPSAAYRPGHEQQNTHTAHRLQIWNNVSYLASYLPGGWHFPDEFLRPFLLSLAVGWLVHHRPGAPDSPQGGKPWGRRRWFLRLLRGRGTALGVMKALSRSLPLRRDAGAGQRLESGSLGRHAFAFFLPNRAPPDIRSVYYCQWAVMKLSSPASVHVRVWTRLLAGSPGRFSGCRRAEGLRKSL